MAVAESIEATKQPGEWVCINCMHLMTDATAVLAHPRECPKNPHYLRGLLDGNGEVFEEMERLLEDTNLCECGGTYCKVCRFFMRVKEEFATEENSEPWRKK